MFLWIGCVFPWLALSELTPGLIQLEGPWDWVAKMAKGTPLAVGLAADSVTPVFFCAFHLPVGWPGFLLCCSQGSF